MAREVVTPQGAAKRPLGLEELLRGRFRTDIIEPVGKGELGADIVSA